MLDIYIYIYIYIYNILLDIYITYNNILRLKRVSSGHPVLNMLRNYITYSRMGTLDGYLSEISQTHTVF